MDEREAVERRGEALSAAQPKRRGRGGLLVGVIAVLLLMGLAAAMSFSRYLNGQLFLERQTHLLEITEKVSEIIDVTVAAAWGNVQTCEQRLLDQGAVDPVRLLADLADMPRYIGTEGAVILAFDQTASYYTSDSRTGHWSDPSIFTAAAPDRQVAISALPYRNINDTYMVFIRRLERPIPLTGTDRQIGHVAVALEIDLLKEVFAVPGFGDSCYTFIVNGEGRRIYKNADLQDFIDGYNILTAMESVTVINGGTIDDLRAAVGSDRQACLEFRYRGENYYVGTALIPSVGWEAMMFVPTDVLGANTNALMARTTWYFLVIGAVALALFCSALFAITSSRNDKKLMRQQQASNLLLTKAAQEAEQANRAKSDFLSRMSHDIRTPINGIMGMTDIAKRHIDDRDRAVECLYKIEGASRHLLSLVNDVLDMSSIESGKTVLAHEPMDLRTMLNNCASIIAGQLLDRRIDFVRDFAGFDHPALLGDELRLRQIFINILGNAVKFTPDGGSIRFAAEEVAATETQATFRFVIQDSGRGMSEDFLTHIFEPFSQEDGHDRSTYSGTGLGMAITKQFVDLMGGRIRVESQLGKGSTFTVELTFDVNGQGPAVRASAPQITELNGMRVLLVEDNELNREIATYMLEEVGVQVTFAQNGREAVDAFQTSQPGAFDVILMDIMMPVMDGMTAAKAIRALDRADASTVPIVAMTANAYEEDRKQTRAAGMNEHLSKPIDRALLLQTLSHYYGQSAASAQEETETNGS